jgi:DNA-binding SARP family transcriptional activator
LIESDHVHSREFLLGLLWPDLPTAAAQNNLCATWAYLQKALGTSKSEAQPYLIGDRLALRERAGAFRIVVGCDFLAGFARLTGYLVGISGHYSSHSYGY